MTESRKADFALLQLYDEGSTRSEEIDRMGLAILPVNLTCLHLAVFNSSAL